MAAASTDAMLATDGGYVHSEGDANWWIPSGRVFYSPQCGRYTGRRSSPLRSNTSLSPHRSRDPFGNTAFVSYDAYDLLVKQTTDPLGNRHDSPNTTTASCSRFG